MPHQQVPLPLVETTNNNEGQELSATGNEKPLIKATTNDKTTNNGAASTTISALQHQINGGRNQSYSSSNGTNNNNNNNTKTATKLNGLKNRIIQRPPPLILDKVSNFYDTETTTQQQPPLAASNTTQQSAKGFSSSSNQNETNSIATSSNQQQAANQNNRNTNSANHKFWASLNQNASRTKSSLVVGGTRSVDNTTKDSVTTTTDSTTNSSLGADLIITHRNSTSGIISTNKSHSNPSLVQQSLSQQQQVIQPKPIASSSNETSTVKETTGDEVVEVPSSNNDNTSKHNMSNNSEFDDSSTHGASENDGGNLVGVDNPTPPGSNAASDSHRILDEPPPSATSSRPRSNNPFLVMDEDELQHDNNIASHNSNFHKRPASFIAATDSTLMHNNLQQQHHQLAYDNNNLASTQQIVQEQFTDIHITDDTHKRSHHLMHVQHPHQHRDSLYSIEGDAAAILIDQQQQHHHQQQESQDQNDSAMYNAQSIMSHHHQQQHHSQMQQPLYGVYCQQNRNYINYEPTISVDSESAVCKPPPSATMQLPHWTDAIYELNNAILETSSVAGGAENGEFIYIVESGDIILELDQIKVSGFTLVEFNELLESKPVYLLNAVQTKHSHGLSTDLKNYLNCSFPKNSNDKELQDLIRENIYRRTIPCTTRPPKEGEVDKVDYHFLNKEQFIEMNNRGMLLECGMFGGHYYGTMRPFSDLNSLSIYGSISQREISQEMQQPLNANHPAIALAAAKQKEPLPTAGISMNNLGENPVYENHESLKMHQQMQIVTNHIKPPQTSHIVDERNQNGMPIIQQQQQSSIVAVDTEALPPGWERVIDQTHGTYYIDHNTQRTQYERPYEIELTKGSMGFGFTLVEADNGVLLVRSVIQGGPAFLNGTIRPGDILISAVGVSVAGLQHTDIARLFSTFAFGDRVRLTFARSTYVVDANLVPDEYLFSNGTNGDLAFAVNNNSSNYYNYFNQNSMLSQSPHILVNQEFEFITVTLKRGDQGFGFTISDSVAGQKVRKIQNNETCTNLKQGDILINLNGLDITKMKHKEVVERLKNCPAGKDVTLIIKRKKRFRSKTPMAMHTEHGGEYSLDSTPQRNCKTPSLDGLMLRKSGTTTNEPVARTLFHNQPQLNQLVAPPQIIERPIDLHNPPGNYFTMPINGQMDSQSIYGINPIANNDIYYNQPQSHHVSSLPQPTIVNTQLNNMDHPHRVGHLRPPSIEKRTPDGGLPGIDNMTNSVNPSEVSMPLMKFANVNGLSQMNQYNNFMNNDKLVMMQMQQQRYQHMMQQQQPPPPLPPSQMEIMQTSDYHHMPLYSNSDMLKAEAALPVKPNTHQYLPEPPSSYNTNYQNNYYANNEEIALQRVQYGCFNNEGGMLPMLDNQSNHSTAFMQPTYSANHMIPNHSGEGQEGSYIEQDQDPDQDEYEYHQVDLDKGNTDSNWGIRLIGGSEADRAISIGSIVFGGTASKNGLLKSGDEIISINGINVVDATHKHVVDLISACSKRASLFIRRKKFAEACQVVLTRNMDEGFGFVIISSGNCALIGRIIEGSPADRCQQLHVRDRIIAVNGRYITPKMKHPEIVNMIKECGSTLRLRIIPADCYTVELIKNAQNDNFGFSMRGGSEYDGTPLYILRVAPNGLARDLLNVGDQIIEINNIPTVGMTHQQAASIIKYSEPIVKLKLRRNYVTPPSLLVDSPRALQKFNQVTAEMKTVNLNSTPSSFIQDGSVSSDVGSSSASQLQLQLQQQAQSLAEQHQQQQGQQSQNNSMVYSQCTALYAA